MTKVKVCRVYDKGVKESTIKVVFEKNYVNFIGPLFSKKDSYQRITRNYDVVEVSVEDESDEVDAVIAVYINLCNKYGIKVYESTERTMRYWQFINGFSKICY